MKKIHKNFLHYHRNLKPKPLLFRDYLIPPSGETNIFWRIFPQNYRLRQRTEARSPCEVVVFFLNICGNGKFFWMQVTLFPSFATRRFSFPIWEIGYDAGEFVTF